MKRLSILLIILISGYVQAQCGMKPISLNERIVLADLVIEGQVVAQETFQIDESSMILTRNTVEITKLFKENQSNIPSTIDIITKGGVLGLKADKVTTSLELFKNDKGIFTLQNYQNGTYQTIAGSQSFIRYSQPDYRAYSALNQWDNIETELFNEITAITRNSYRRVAPINFNYTPSLSKMGTPSITNVSPLSVNAGVGDVITINGSGFGATQGSGTVVFSNADDGGSLNVPPDNTQFISWNDTEIIVQVPSGAGNGPIAVLEDTGNSGVSPQNLAIGYNHVNFTFGLSTGNAVAEVSLYNDNNSGGYDFDYATGFVAVPDASATLDDIYEKWRCTTGVNFVRGTDLTAQNSANTDNPSSSGSDFVNVVKFDGNDLPAGSTTLAFVLTRASGCIINNQLTAFVDEMDVVINDAINWHYRDGGASSTSLDFSEYDFESVMLHEIGHAQQLGHVIDPTKVMHFSIANGSQSRSIDEADIEGATYINDKSTSIAPCGSPAMELADCNFIYTNSSWTPFDPSGTFNPNSTITAQDGIASVTDKIGTRDMTIDNNATLSTASGNEILLHGNLTNNGTATFDYLSMQGDTNQSINGSSITVNEFELSNSTSINLNAPVEVITSFNNDGSTLNTNGNLVMKSTANGTAHVDAFEGTINGDVIVERYYPAKRAFRFMSPSVTTSSSIFENWQENGVFVAGIGTHISGSTTGANGFDTTISGNPSLFTYDNTGSNGWIAATSTNASGDILTAGNAYRLFVRGDRDPSLLTGGGNVNETTVRATGTLSTGNTSGPALSNVANAFGFAGNPYQAPVDMEAVLTRSGSNLAPSYYIWDPNLNTNGAYVTINTVTKVSSNSGSPANQYAQPNQAFFVQTAANGAASINFTEADKALDQGNLAVNSAHGTMRISALLKNGNGTTILDGFNMIFDNNFSNAITINDAQKLNNIDESTSIEQNGLNYSIAERALPNDQESIQLIHTNYRDNSYTYFIHMSGAPLNAYLFDNYENMRYELVNNATTSIAFTIDANDPLSSDVRRFSIEFSNQTLSTLEQESKLFKVYPNPSNGTFQVNLNQAGMAQVEIYNLLGQKVYSSDITNQRIHTIETTLSSGNYILKATQDGTVAAEKIIIK
ncbi:MAG: T9SS type A sorting domain-containing protein [Nonlabens sp.]|uniref:T9SS type A sorting domain-containing protein n=1 Tax=Nonlabens sp. TaxID=1888209 RepID=UPI003EFAE202